MGFKEEEKSKNLSIKTIDWNKGYSIVLYVEKFIKLKISSTK